MYASSPQQDFRGLLPFSHRRNSMHRQGGTPVDRLVAGLMGFLSIHNIQHSDEAQQPAPLIAGWYKLNLCLNSENSMVLQSPSNLQCSGFGVRESNCGKLAWIYPKCHCSTQTPNFTIFSLTFSSYLCEGKFWAECLCTMCSLSNTTCYLNNCPSCSLLSLFFPKTPFIKIK